MVVRTRKNIHVVKREEYTVSQRPGDIRELGPEESKLLFFTHFSIYKVRCCHYSLLFFKNNLMHPYVPGRTPLTSQIELRSKIWKPLQDNSPTQLAIFYFKVLFGM